MKPSITKDPVPGRCIIEVPDRWTRWPSYHQCSRKAVVDGKYCRQHAPDAVAKRERETAEKQEREWQLHRKRMCWAEFYDALKKIAAGHNDPRGLAQSIVDRFKR